jgi:hypothetical protein
MTKNCKSFAYIGFYVTIAKNGLMEFFLDTETSLEEMDEIRTEIRDMIAKCGLSEVRYDENPVMNVDRSIVLHGTFELIELIVSPLLSEEDLIEANDLDEELMMNCSSAVIYPLFEERGKDMAM